MLTLIITLLTLTLTLITNLVHANIAGGQCNRRELLWHSIEELQNPLAVVSSAEFS